jgi:hypothetical protein
MEAKAAPGILPLSTSKGPSSPRRVPARRNPERTTSASTDYTSSPRRVPARQNPERTTSAPTDCRPKHVFPVAHEDDYYGNSPNLENMLIECDFSDSSGGDITYDATVARDEEFFRSNRNYKPYPQTARNTTSVARVHKSHVESYSKSPTKSCIRPTPHVIPDDDARSADKEEQRLIELAMERSLQDSSSRMGSVTSTSRKSATSERSFQSRTSTGSYRSCSESNLGSAGCHLSMIGRRTSQNRGLSQTVRDGYRGGPPGDAGPNFVWKREGKRWLKIPKDHLTSKSLQAIEEDMNESFHHSRRRLILEGNMSEEEKLEHMEQQMIEEAMQRSLSSCQQESSPSSHRMQESLASSMNSILQMSDCGSSDGSIDIDPVSAIARLRELEEEKAMLQLAMQRSMDGRGAQPNRELPRSLKPSSRSLASNSNYQGRSSRSLSFRSNESQKTELSGAGCHLAMIGRRSGQSYDAADNDLNRGVGRALSEDSRNSQGQNLVWKRGPNSRWGRFPDDDNDAEPNVADEDELVAEALKRSLQDM